MLFPKSSSLFRLLPLCILFLQLSTYSLAWETSCKDKNDIKVLGLIESFAILSSNSQPIQSTALLDTGATHSVIHARNISIKKSRSSQSIVTFDIKDIRSGSWKTVDRPFIRYAWIKTHHGSPVKRVVVALPLQVGTITSTSEFYLMDRQAFKYPALLGRSFLKDRAVVDASRQHIANYQYCMDIVDR